METVSVLSIVLNMYYSNKHSISTNKHSIYYTESIRLGSMLEYMYNIVMKDTITYCLHHSYSVINIIIRWRITITNMSCQLLHCHDRCYIVVLNMTM